MFDVAKYIIEEEVVREREVRYVSEVRRSLTVSAERVANEAEADHDQRKVRS